MNRGCVLAKLDTLHAKEAARLHHSAFPQFFLTSLGEVFLKLLYEAFAADSSCVSYIAVGTEGTVCGFVAGTLHPAGFYRRVLAKRWFAFAAASIPAVLRKPSIAPRLLRAIVYRGGGTAGSTRALLSSIAVHPTCRVSGVGSALITKWCDEVRQRGALGAYLTTDAECNDAVNRFYQRHGWVIERTFVTPEGRRMNLYTREL